MNRVFINRRQHGSSMIEVLVTMIIIALGLLGQASLVALSSKSNNAAFARSQATLLSYDIIERLRLNRAAAVNGDFTTDFATESSDYDGSEIYEKELHNWKANVEQALPSGQAKIDVTGVGGVTISIQWSEVVKGSTDDGSITPTKFVTQSVI
jgi:type IV pilus assembly protein PilV